MDTSQVLLDGQKNKYSPVILKNSSQLPSEFNEIIHEYLLKTGQEYVNIDLTMIDILKKYDNIIGFYFRIVYIHNDFLAYYKIIDHGSFEELMINYDKYKIDLIKKYLSIEVDHENLISLIESIVFKNFNDAIKTEAEYSLL